MSFTTKAELHYEPYGRLSPATFASELSGKHVLISGGGYGVGASIARAYAEANVASIVIAGRTESKLKATTEEISSAFPKTKIEYRVVDVTSIESTKAMYQSITTPLSVLINNAGFLSSPGNFITADLKEWWQNYEVNVLGAANVTQGFLQARAKQNASDPALIVNLNTFAAYGLLFPNFTGYASSKTGLWRMMELLGQDANDASVLPGGARIINVHPGLVETAMGDKAGLKGFVPSTNPQLAAEFIVWTTTGEASFLANRLAWVNWDVDELLARKGEIVEGDKLRTTIS